MESLKIKAVAEGDFGAWLPLWKSYRRFYEMDIPETVARETWRRFLDPVEPLHAALAFVGELAVGLAHTIYHRSTCTRGDYCYLQDLFVRDDARGLDVGRELIEYVYADARRRGAPGVY